MDEVQKRIQIAAIIAKLQTDIGTVQEAIDDLTLTLCEAKEKPKTGNPMGRTDQSMWLCPRCMVCISNLEYEHLNKNGCCDTCETQLEQYEKVEWRP